MYRNIDPESQKGEKVGDGDVNMVEEYMKNKDVREPKSTWKWNRLNTATLHINREYIHVTNILLQICVKQRGKFIYLNI